MSRSFSVTLLSCLSLSLAACASGGEKPEAKAPSDAESAAAAPESEAPAEDATADEEKPAEDAPPPTPEKKASEILTTPDVAFAFDYNNSGLKEKHEEKCKAVKDNPAQLAACIEKERAAFKADVLQFTTAADGTLVWIVFMRKGNSLSEVFQSPCEFKDEKGTTLTLALTGKGKGTQQIFAGQRQIPLTVPNKYGIEIEDPKFGKLTYASKVGLVAAKPAQ